MVCSTGLNITRTVDAPKQAVINILRPNQAELITPDGMRQVLHLVAEDISGAITPIGKDIGSSSTTTEEARICLYSNVNYGGTEQCYTADVSNLVDMNFNDEAESIKVYNAIVVVYEHSNYSGERHVYTENSATLADNDIRNDITSLELFESDVPMVCLYEHTDYSGQGRCFIEGTTSIGVELRGEISSVKVYNGAIAVLYKDEDYNGGRYTYTADTTSLVDEGTNDVFSSLEITYAPVLTYEDVDDDGEDDMIVTVRTSADGGYFIYDPLAIAHFLRSYR